MTVSTLITCPYCIEKNARYSSLRAAFRILNDPTQAAPEGATHAVLGNCYHCKNTALLYFKIPDGITFPTASNVDLVADERFTFIDTAPAIFKGTIPEHLPSEVQAILETADEVMRSGQFAMAAIGYGAALDVALTNICAPADISDKTIGGKIGEAKKLGKIGDQIADLLEGANSARIIGAHFVMDISGLDARTARELTTAALENMFTYPKRIDEMRQRLDDVRHARSTKK